MGSWRNGGHAGVIRFWIAARVGQLTSIEHDAEWYRRGHHLQQARGVTNINFVHAPHDPADTDGSLSPYVQTVNNFPVESLDFCLVDGIYRGQCVLAILSKLKRGGVMAIDNAGWFLPSGSQCPHARKIGDGPMDSVWQRVIDQTESWRKIWTTSDVTDTVLFFKP